MTVTAESMNNQFKQLVSSWKYLPGRVRTSWNNSRVPEPPWQFRMSVRLLWKEFHHSLFIEYVLIYPTGTGIKIKEIMRIISYIYIANYLLIILLLIIIFAISLWGGEGIKNNYCHIRGKRYN